MFIYQILKKPFFGRFQKKWRWPENYENKDTWEEVSFYSMSKANLSGLYGPSLSDFTKGNIVCAHPMGISAKGYFLKRDIADKLRMQGYNVLLFDFNGFGNSTNGNLDLPADVNAAGRFLQRKAPGYTLGIFGISFGASMAVCSFSRDDNQYVSAVFESAFTSLKEFWAHYGILGQFIKLFPLLMPGMEKRMNALYNTGKIKNTENILWIHGAEDRETPAEMGIRFQNAAAIPTERWVVPNGKHADCYDKDPAGYSKKLIEFFNKTLSENK